MILLLDGVPVYGIVIEAQLTPDERKRFVWPVYAVNLRARLELPVCTLVVTVDEPTARWARSRWILAAAIATALRARTHRCPPEVIDEAQARLDPELAVLSAMAHGQDADSGKVVQIALAAQLASLGLDEIAPGYTSISCSLRSAKRLDRELRAMDPAKYEYQSDFAKRYVAQGRAEGALEGRAALVLRQLTRRFGPLPPAAAERLGAASVDELDAIGERLLTAQSLDEALGPQ